MFSWLTSSSSSPATSSSDSQSEPATTSTPTSQPAASVPVSSRPFASIQAEEDARLRAELPTPAEVPGCLTLFDTYLTCYMLRPQLLSIYRYGEYSECSVKLEDFKWCMAQKGLDAEGRRDAWIQRRAEWWARRRTERSSEDVWNIRKEPLENFPPTGEIVLEETLAT